MRALLAALCLVHVGLLLAGAAVSIKHSWQSCPSLIAKSCRRCWLPCTVLRRTLVWYALSLWPSAHSRQESLSVKCRQVTGVGAEWKAGRQVEAKVKELREVSAGDDSAAIKAKIEELQKEVMAIGQVRQAPPAKD